MLDDPADATDVKTKLTAAAGERPMQHTWRKRALAGFLSLLAPGVGHYLLGRPRTGVALALALVVSGASMIAAAVGSSAALFWTLCAPVVAVDLVLFAHPLTIVEGTSPPTWKVVVAGGLTVLFFQVAREWVRADVVESFGAASASMYPTIEPGSKFFISKLDRRPRAGDTVAYVKPNGNETFAKRVVAVGGDTIEIRQDIVLVNGKPLSRRKLERPCTLGTLCELWAESVGGQTYEIALSPERASANFDQVTVVPPGTVYVLGDDREESFDSRHHGPVPLSNVVGKLSLTWW